MVLTSLEFESLLIEWDENLLSNTLSSTNIRTGRLESVCLKKFIIEDSDDAIEKTNLYSALFFAHVQN